MIMKIIMIIISIIIIITMNKFIHANKLSTRIQNLAFNDSFPAIECKHKHQHQHQKIQQRTNTKTSNREGRKKLSKIQNIMQNILTYSFFSLFSFSWAFYTFFININEKCQVSCYLLAISIQISLNVLECFTLKKLKVNWIIGLGFGLNYP